MPEATYLGWVVLFIGGAITFSSNPAAAATTTRDVTLVRLVAGVALILFGFLRIIHVI